MRQRHGGTGTPEHEAWKSARQRCRNQNYERYRDWGGRGITFDARWDDFTVFLADMGPKPTPKHTLERIDNDGPYSPENCRWATTSEQNKNKRRRRTIRVEDLLFYTTLTYEDIEWIFEQKGSWT